MNYRSYLKTDHWREFRRMILDENPYCERCGEIATQVHHITYENLGNETDADVEALCVKCHKEEHFLDFDDEAEF